MGWLNINGIYIGRNSGSWSSYWSHRNEVLFFAYDPTNILNKVVGGKLYNQKSGAVDYATVTGTGLNAVYAVPDTAAYKSADTDYCHFKTDASRSICDGNRLIAYDFTRTIVKYSNTAPYVITAIMILSSDVDTARMRNDFDLSIWWSNVLSDYGNTKDNRAAEKSIWTAESVYTLHDTFTDTDAVHLADHTMDVGVGWIAPDNFTISGNKLICTGVVAPTAYWAIAESSAADVTITISLTIPDKANYLGGVAFRYQDNTHYWLCALERDAGTPYIVLAENGTTQRGKVNITQELITDTLKIVISGNDISCYWKDMVTPLITYSSASYNTLTKHGILAYCASGGGTAYEFPIVDNFIIQ